MTMICEIDPLRDARWPRFLERQERASVFHSREWLNALHRTYGYIPGVLAAIGPDAELTQGLVFCRVQSWLTGKRVVSLPFSDHCTPLLSNAEELQAFVTHLRHECPKNSYIELRCLARQTARTITPSESYCLHRLDLRRSTEELYQGFHANHVRRKIARAERERLEYEEGRSETLLRKLHKLAVLTRRRHSLPPQPLDWFRNLIACMGDRLKIRLVSHGGQPVAATITLRHKGTLTYKYGFSDVRFHRLGSMQLLLWRAIQEAKDEGLDEFDMGRSDWSNPGLIAFKDHWGADRSTILHVRDPMPRPQRNSGKWGVRLAAKIVALAPDRLLTTAGNLLYRHMA